MDFGVDLDNRGLLLREVSISCFRFGDTLRAGEAPVRDAGVDGGDPCREGAHSIFSGLGEPFLTSSPTSTTSSFSGDLLTLKSKGALLSFAISFTFVGFGDSVWTAEFVPTVGGVIGCNVPFGNKKHGVSGVGRFEPGSRPGRTLAPRNKEYGTIMMGFVGNARKGCWGGSAAPGEGGVRHVSTGEAGVEPEVQLEAALEAVVVAEAVLRAGLIMCLELQ